MEKLVKRTIPIYICFIVAMVMLIEYFINTGTNIGDIIRKWAVDLVAWTSLLGFIMSTRSHGAKVIKRSPGWVFSAWLIFLLWAMTFIGITLRPAHDSFQWLTKNVLIATYSGILGTCGLFVMTASYRAFRARNLESALMLIAGVIMMISNVTIGEVIFPPITGIRAWLLDVPVAATQRGIIITAAIGYIGICLRAIIGVETSWLGREVEE